MGTHFEDDTLAGSRTLDSDGTAGCSTVRELSFQVCTSLLDPTLCFQRTASKEPCLSDSKLDLYVE